MTSMVVAALAGLALFADGPPKQRNMVPDNYAAHVGANTLDNAGAFVPQDYRDHADWHFTFDHVLLGVA